MKLDPVNGSHREAVRAALEREITEFLREASEWTLVGDEDSRVECIASRLAARLDERGWL